MNLCALVKSAAVCGGARRVNSCVVVQAGNSGHMRPPVAAERPCGVFSRTRADQRCWDAVIPLLRLVSKLGENEQQEPFRELV